MILVELALILFLAFRKAGGSCLLRLLLSAMAFMALLMALLSLAVLLGEGRTIDFADNDGPFFIGLAIALGIIAIWLASMRDESPSKPPQGQTENAGDAADPPPKRSLFFDMIGCALLGAIALVALTVLIAAGIGLAGR
ncbi:MAG TPA: hypothetical protein VFV30_08130 [Novosphingobium sp.]|nr:hypothetical protein [Novosphingobium sp.]